MNHEMILSFLNKVIKVDRGGPESRVGMLLAAEEDHVIVLTEDEGVIYYKTQHIKSITYNAKNELQFGVEIPEDFEFTKAPNFKGVLDNLKYRWVKVNRGGPEMLEGILDDVSDEYAIIISNEEIIRLSMYHIRNISYGVKVEKVKADENVNVNVNENKDKESNKEEK
jgi:spore coat protein B